MTYACLVDSRNVALAADATDTVPVDSEADSHTETCAADTSLDGVDCLDLE